MSTVLRLSDAASLALHTVRLLAEEADRRPTTRDRRPRTRDRRLTTRDIASKLSVSESHLSKVLQRLAARGLVESVRGPKGGFTLAGEPSAITMMDVYEAIDGPLASDACLLGRATCVADTCMFGGLLETINTLVREHMQRTRFSDLSGGNGRTP